MSRWIDIDDFITHMNNMTEKAKEDGCKELAIAAQMVVYQVELYAKTFGTKEM